MKSISKISHIFRTSFCLGLAFLLTFTDLATPAESSGTNKSAAASSDSDKAWKDLQKALRPPMPPAEWQGNPTPEQRQAFHVEQGKLAGDAADKAKDFYTRFPNHEKTAEARKPRWPKRRKARVSS